MLYIVANTIEEYHRYKKAKGIQHVDTKYISDGHGLRGLVGEVVIVNFGDFKFTQAERTHLRALRETGRVTSITRDSF